MWRLRLKHHKSCYVEEKLHEENMQKYMLPSAASRGDKVVDTPVEMHGTSSSTRLQSVQQSTSVQRWLNDSTDEGC